MNDERLSDIEFAGESLTATRWELLEGERLQAFRFDSIALVGEPPDSRIRVVWAVPARGTTGSMEFPLFDPEWFAGTRSSAMVAAVISVHFEEIPHPL